MFELLELFAVGLGRAGDQLVATTTAGENSRSLHKFQANNDRRRARVALNSS
jgi:hypothetical protein